MLFNSYIFILAFLPFTLVLYFLLNKMKRYQMASGALLIMSLVFYGYFNVDYLVIIIGSIILNYLIDMAFRRISTPVWRKSLLILALVGNLGVLFYFKYFGFFVENINLLFNLSFNVEKVLLPLGISFFTFQQLSFVIDSYKGTVPKYDFLNYALFVTFFPQLIAGPIVLHSEVIPQFQDENKRKFNWENFAKGITAFAYGLGKKVLIADVFGQIVEFGFSNIEGLGTINAILVMLSYTIQIYFDFSGYCDMATGIGLMFNIEIPMNFNSPYKALTIDEFWKRWHITLTRFFRTYVYFPLGGSRKGKVRTYINLFVVFLVSGLWHGANWTFIFWGMLHGIALVINRMFREKINKLHPALSWLMTFAFVNIAWIYFRADSIAQANSLVKEILIFEIPSVHWEITDILMIPEIRFGADIISYFIPYMVAYVEKEIVPTAFLLIIFAILGMKNTNEKIRDFKPNFKTGMVTMMLLLLSIISLSGVSTFLYFNF